MTTVVIMPGGFHPFHAGHAALYDSIKRSFPGAEVFVAATNDTSTRPFPFAVKEKLAQLAGVDAGHFVQVKSPFRAEEITSKFDPNKDTLIFVRSEKDADKPPQAGGIKKDGNPAYLQPLLGAAKLEPFAKHAYMAYLPTVEFGPGMTSATEIRTAWPTLNPKRKTALVMSLYPTTQTNPKLAANVVAMLDTAIGSELEENQGWAASYNETRIISPKSVVNVFYRPFNSKRSTQLARAVSQDMAQRVIDSYVARHTNARLPVKVDDFEIIPINQDQYRRTTEADNQIAGTPAVGGMWAGYQQRENQPVAEDYAEEKRS